MPRTERHFEDDAIVRRAVRSAAQTRNAHPRFAEQRRYLLLRCVSDSRRGLDLAIQVVPLSISKQHRGRWARSQHS